MTKSIQGIQSIRGNVNRWMLMLLWFHVPSIGATGALLGTHWLTPSLIMVTLCMATTGLWYLVHDGLVTSLFVATSLMSAVSLLVFQFQGHPWQIDMHLYFFVALAILVAYCDYRVIVLATVLVALHHLTLNFLLPTAIYPAGGAGVGRVGMHAVILLSEAGVLAVLAIKLSRLFTTASDRIEETNVALVQVKEANAQREAAETEMARGRQESRRHLADEFERKVGSIVETFTKAAASMQAASRSLTDMAARSSLQSSAAVQTSSQQSGSMQMIVSATEQMTASINNIQGQTTVSRDLAGDATARVQQTTSMFEVLSTRASRIDQIITLIRNIANQTNLLALNATIEAARAGEQGKGFAVVAHEVKALAKQTANATKEISDQIGDIQTAAQEATGSIGLVDRTIGSMDEVAGAIATAIAEQNGATKDISAHVQSAAMGADDMARNIVDITKISREVGHAAGQVLSASEDLLSQSQRLSAEMSDFLNSVRVG